MPGTESVDTLFTAVLCIFIFNVCGYIENQQKNQVGIGKYIYKYNLVKKKKPQRWLLAFKETNQNTLAVKRERFLIWTRQNNVQIKKRSFLTSCVLWFVSLNASSHLCFRFFVTSWLQFFVCLIFHVPCHNRSAEIFILVSASLPFRSRHFQTRSLWGWELFIYDLQEWL